MKMALLEILVVGLASAVGGILRLFIGRSFNTLAFPVGTMLINITGSFFLGWFLTFMANRIVINDPDLKKLLTVGIAVGFVGAYTTFSTFMFESDKMLQDGLGFRLMFYLAGSIVLGLIAVRLGVMLGQRV